MPPPARIPLSSHSIEEGATHRGRSAFIQRRNAPSSSPTRSPSLAAAVSPPHPPVHPSHVFSLSSLSSPSSSCLTSPLSILLLTIGSFVLLLGVTAFAFFYLKSQHGDHLFPLPAAGSPDSVLSQHPAFVSLQHRLSIQYQQLLTIARRHMTEDKWRELQAEAAQLNDGNPDAAATALDTTEAPAAAATADCPPPPACPPAAAPPPAPECQCSCQACSALSRLSGAELMTDWSVNSTVPLQAADLSLQSAAQLPASHAWTYCPSRAVKVPWLGERRLCDTADFRMEQWFEKQQFVIPGSPSEPILKPVAPSCIWPPPADYRFPPKHAPLPAVNDSHSLVHWPNHFVMNWQNLSAFNYGYDKNLYHFNAPVYDRQQLDRLDRVAAVIPFASQVRNGLDVGAGGGSLSLLLRRRYEVAILNLVYAELPYCEYITERGGLCAYITAFASFPFSKFSFDFVHIAWLFHMFSGANLVTHLMEVHRVIRPGGYLWWEGGFSYAQRETVRDWSVALGYAVLWEESVDSKDGTMFGKEKHQCDWTVVFRKASRPNIDCSEKASDDGKR